MEDKPKKRSILSLLRTPKKSPKLSQEYKNVDGVIDLISDDEDNKETQTQKAGSQKQDPCAQNQEVSAQNTSATGTPNSPNTTVEYCVGDSNQTTSSPKSNKSPFSKKKYYSPVKQRSVSVKSPGKAKRNLNLSLEMENIQDEKFIEVIKDVDDSTYFFIKMIYQYINDTNLRHLLDETSLTLLEKCKLVPKSGMRIVCRLYWQVEQWCRFNKIKKNACKHKCKNGNNCECIDDPTVQQALNSLIETGYIAVAQYNGQNHDLDFDEVTEILTAKEIIEICKEFKLKVTTKTDGINALNKFKSSRNQITNYFSTVRSDNERRVLKSVGLKLGKCYKLADQAKTTLKELYVLMFLGMQYRIIRDKKLELTLTNVKYMKESFPIDEDFLLDNAGVVFKNRQEFERYLCALFIQDEFLGLIKAKAELPERFRLIERVFSLYKAISEEEMMSYISLPVWLHRFTPPHIYVKVLEEGVVELKKDTSNVNLIIEILTALLRQDIFRQHKKAEWFAEKALIYDKFLGDPEAAAEVLLEGFTSNLPITAKKHLCPRAMKIAKRKVNPVSEDTEMKLTLSTISDRIFERNLKATHVYKVPRDNYGRGKIEFETFDKSGQKVYMSAEEYGIHHYVNSDNSKFTHGGHWEGRIITTIFFLLFWDVIYARLRGLRGLYLSRYQEYPLDLFTESFYTNRKLMIKKRLKEIEESSKEAMVTMMQATWENRPECEWSGINRSIGWENISGVAACLGPRRVAELCRRLAADYRRAQSGFPDLTLWNELTGQIMFAEVKTDSDKPSIKQIQWMHFLDDHDFDVEFCYIGVHTTRARSRNTAGFDSDDE